MSHPSGGRDYRAIPKVGREGKMTPEQIREMGKLIREHFRLQAEIRSLAAILEGAEQVRQPPWGWRQALKQLRLTESYRKISEQYAQQLTHIEQAADENELRRLIDTIPPTAPMSWMT
jgi:hypothetical protein